MLIEDDVFPDEHALAGRRTESYHIDQDKLLCFRALHDHCCQRMFAEALRAGDELKQAGFLDVRLRDDGTQCRLTFGECSGLVDDERVNLAEHFQHLSQRDASSPLQPGGAKKLYSIGSAL